jgi:hypothetical protein
VEDRFKGNPKWVFQKLKRLTKYDQYDKRDGGVVTRALNEDGRLVSGREL